MEYTLSNICAKVNNTRFFDYNKILSTVTQKCALKSLKCFKIFIRPTTEYVWINCLEPSWKWNFKSKNWNGTEKEFVLDLQLVATGSKPNNFEKKGCVKKIKCSWFVPNSCLNRANSRLNSLWKRTILTTISVSYRVTNNIFLCKHEVLFAVS